MKKDNCFNLWIYTTAFILLSVLSSTSSAQPVVSVTASKTAIRTGEPDTIQLKASWQGHSLQKGFIVPDSFPHFEVWDKGTAIPNESGIIQDIVITSYDSGRFNLPPFELADVASSKTDSLSINVQPVNVDSLQEYHDIKDIIEVPPVPQWPFVLLIAGLTLISLAALYFLLRNTGMGKQATAGKLAKAGAYERAMEALQKLEPQTKGAGMAKPFYTSLTGIYRTYLQEAYRYRSLQQTGGEIILQAKPLLVEESFYKFANTIRLADAVKFAKYEPSQTDWISSLAIIRHTIEEMEKRFVSNNQQQPVSKQKPISA